MNRVVVTGMGIVSSLGANKSEVLDSLRSAKSGIEFSETYRDMGLRSHVLALFLKLIQVKSLTVRC